MVGYSGDFDETMRYQHIYECFGLDKCVCGVDRVNVKVSAYSRSCSSPIDWFIGAGW
jgi:hypothetical protein